MHANHTANRNRPLTTESFSVAPDRHARDLLRLRRVLAWGNIELSASKLNLYLHERTATGSRWSKCRQKRFFALASNLSTKYHHREEWLLPGRGEELNVNPLVGRSKSNRPIQQPPLQPCLMKFLSTSFDSSTSIGTMQRFVARLRLFVEDGLKS